MSTSPLNKLCLRCETLDLTPPPSPEQRKIKVKSQVLYPSLLQVDASSQAGCHLCTLILTSLCQGVDEKDNCLKQYHGLVQLTCEYSLTAGEYQLLVQCPNFSWVKLRCSVPSPAYVAECIPRDELKYPKIHEDSASPKIFDQIAKWMDRCARDHPRCQRDGEASLPTRLIDVGPSDGSLNPRLIVAGDGMKGKYATLSYRWGTCPTCTTTYKTYSSHCSGMQIDQLPATLRDAIFATRRLGLHYIWIDALCIIQDSPEDWQKHATQMATIYRNSWVTISADSAIDSAAGFLKSRDLRSILPCYHQPSGVTVYPSVQRAVELLNRRNYGINTRGWVLQERIFGNPIIHWTQFEVAWECRELHASERDPIGSFYSSWEGSVLRRMLAPSSKREENSLSAIISDQETKTTKYTEDRTRRIYAAWYSLVRDYCNRVLTYPDKDKLVALAGIGVAFHETCHGVLGPESSYVSGLWTRDIALGLAFVRYNWDDWRQKNNLGRATRCDPERYETWVHRMPSFSWTALDGPVEWPVSTQVDVEERLYEFDVQFISSSVRTAAPESWASHQTEWIIVRGVLISKDDMVNLPNVDTFLDSDQPDTTLPPRAQFLRLMVRRDGCDKFVNRWLILHPVSLTGEHHKGFRRLGIMKTRGSHLLNYATLTDVKLV